MTNGKKFFVAASPLLLLVALTAGIRLTQSNPEIPVPAESSLKGGHSIPPAKVVPADPRLQATLKKVVLGQIRAFHTGDYDAALSYSVPGFRANLTPERFRQMIETGFSPLASSRYEKCRTALLSGKSATMTVQVVDATGAERAFVYALGNMEGRWLITGCSPIITPGMFAASGAFLTPRDHPPFEALREAARVRAAQEANQGR
jgi:hypothetical protein